MLDDESATRLTALSLDLDQAFDRLRILSIPFSERLDQLDSL